MTRHLGVDAKRIGDDLEALAALTEASRPYTRRAFTPMFLKGRAYLQRRFREAGLETAIDVAGNLVGRRPGARRDAGVIMLGSHSDTVPDGGRFDGVAGVIAALEVARSLADKGVALDHDLEIVDFLAEEVSIFGVSCVGSRGMTGVRPDDWLSRQVGGKTLADGITEVGGDATQPLRRSDVRAFLELHIEQGPVLERCALDVGVVTAIAGITRIEVVVEGRADHAGTTPMDLRRDALAAAARLVVAVETLANEGTKGSTHFAATVGEFSVEPNAANVVPSRVRMLLDVRAESGSDLERFQAGLHRAIAEVAALTGVSVATPRLVSSNAATSMDGRVMDVLDKVCVELGVGHRRLVSGAGHDAAFMASVTKAGMVFITCKDGRSHTPEEWVETADVARGTAVLFEAVQLLDKQLEN
jgi:beta-ureidopropionase / N-carbamoyl-L-amino-acid hydrolase